MTRVLSELLAADEPQFGMAIARLEQASGGESIDVRLTAEIIGKVHMKMRALGLDPADTTGRELYNALLGLVQKHDAFLVERIGGTDPADVSALLPRIKDVVEALDVPRGAWVVKHSVAKRLVKAMPPKKVMKQLGYRSIDSMVKRESIGEIYAGITLLENEAWQTKFIASYKLLRPTDFEVRKVEVLQFDAAKWGDSCNTSVASKRHNILHIKEVGVVAIMPLPLKRAPGVTITTLSLLLHYINEIRIYSSFFKLQQVKPNFAQILINTLTSDSGKHVQISGQHVHWRVIHRHFGSLEESRAHPDMFQPHVEPEDMAWRRTEETLYRLEPALHFWFDAEYVAVEFDGRPVSFNLMDVAVSYVNGLPYGNQAVHHFRDSLWNELYMRYLGQQSLEKQVLKQLGETPDIL